MARTLTQLGSQCRTGVSLRCWGGAAMRPGGWDADVTRTWSHFMSMCMWKRGTFCLSSHTWGEGMADTHNKHSPRTSSRRNRSARTLAQTPPSPPSPCHTQARSTGFLLHRCNKVMSKPVHVKGGTWCWQYNTTGYNINRLMKCILLMLLRVCFIEIKNSLRWAWQLKAFKSVVS